jgi:hypothetical protein
MNYSDRHLRQIANYSTVDVMLADVAVRIQLSPTDYQLAVDHYHAINDWLERDDSLLKGCIRDFYPQGGFAIGATVARHSSDDEFDIDVMADISYRLDVDPEYALATLHDAIRGERDSRYHSKTDRKTRCSSVNYDGMHLDVTPTVRIGGTVEKTGVIFHSKPEEPWAKKSLLANPHGFAQWFIAQTPPDQDFGAFFERLSLDYDRARAMVTKRADAVPVPEQYPAFQKSRAVIALQLIKRWRNLAYDKRHADPAATVGAAGLLRGYLRQSDQDACGGIELPGGDHAGGGRRGARSRSEGLRPQSDVPGRRADGSLA